MRSRIALAPALAFALAAVLALVAAPAPPVQAAPAATATYNIWAWNVAGWKMNRASTTNGMVSGAVASIGNRGAQFVVFNELCWQQYKAIQSGLRNAGWPQDVNNFSRWEPQTSASCNGEPYGLAIFSKAPLGTAERLTLAQDESQEQRKLLCAPLAAQPKVRFCGTHITPSNTVINGRKINETQLGQVLARIESHHAAGGTTVIAGDFNAQPSYGRLNTWYDAALSTPDNPDNTGNYRELDDTDPRCPGYGEATTENNILGKCGQASKIDLIFIRKNKLTPGYTSDALAISQACDGPCSDHRITTGTASITY
ncbi:endonuclease/exonuclease/phosphatase family protein [Kribbella amoyensis]|uniref:Endonuclease/exonuclease/phosphatase family protein n=1 Tax=Kribbella amoyensis TaxID=996641 RepID=A0A561BRM9_9ACTN|nr:endonuclease/exonuclease/phosphatase family protein [Kribbella amoyensis]TWD81531.1 endonuclease/exonuclease/phosphatase family protein [Kribbella amoyensis]